MLRLALIIDAVISPVTFKLLNGWSILSAAIYDAVSAVSAYEAVKALLVPIVKIPL